MNLEEFAAAEKRRKEALTSQNALVYTDLCDSQCVSPEDQNLYDQGLAERSRLAIEAQRLAEDEEANPYIDFVTQVRAIGLNVQNRKSFTDTKQTLLTRCFPGRFGKGGTQPLSGYTSGKIGAVFSRVYYYARELTERRRS